MNVFAHLRSSAALCVMLTLGSLTGAQEASHPKTQVLSAEQAIAELEQGNLRCVDGKSAHGHDIERWRERYLVEQNPFAIVLGCSDSRVAPELLFDQGFGELFVIRVAGNIVDDDVVGSIQYAVEHLDNKLIVVLGHQNCGAVTAALSPPDQARSEPTELTQLLNRIRPAIASVDRDLAATERLAKAVEANARTSVRQLRESPSIAKAIKEKGVKIVGAVYHIDSGRITFFNEEAISHN